VLTAYGHSWVYGTGARRHSEGFVGLAARQLGVGVSNHAESGSLSTETARLVIARPPEPAGRYVLMTGFNDARLHGAAPAGQRQYQESLEIVFGALHKADPQAVTLAVEQPYIENYSGHPPYDQASDAIDDRYNSILRTTVAGFPSARAVVVNGWDATTMLAADNVHPNDRGHAVLARALVRAITGRTGPDDNS
jgi:lysophospholipase L1-like esterase